jgi:hypothetical protein
MPRTSTQPERYVSRDKLQTDESQIRIFQLPSISRVGRASFFLHATITAAALSILGLVVYGRFVFGGNTLLYKDVGSDSLNISYPYYVLFSNYLREIGIPSWSFHIGMGQDLFPYAGNLILSPVVWLPKGAIANALAYQHLLYLIVAGLLFAGFLRARSLTFQSSLLGAVLLSFSAYMCMGCCWYFHAAEVVCFTFLLLAAEQSVSQGRWLWLVLAVATVGLLGVFHLYLAVLLLSFYVPLRLLDRYSSRPWFVLRLSSYLAAAAFLGVGLAGIVDLENLRALLDSPRGSGMVAPTWSRPAPFEFGSNLYYTTAVLRAFSNDILGTGNDFRGWTNYFEAPMSYCGLLSLLIFPQVFVSSSRRQRILYAFFIGFVIVPILFPWFRHLFWLFKGGYFRAFSLFSILGLITLSMTAFSRYALRGVNLWILGTTLLVLVGVLYLPIYEMQGLIQPEIRQTVVIFLFLYAALLAAGHLLKRQRTAAWVIVGLTAVELIRFGQITVNRPTVTKPELNQRIGYNDETIDAMHDIKASDGSFFRVTKTWGSSQAMYPSLDDAMVFGYYGTTSYSSFNNLNYIRFLTAVGAIFPEDDLAVKSTWSTGLQGHPLLSVFACEKYVLTKEPVSFETAEQYDFVRRYGNIYLFRNTMFLPFGLIFNRYLAEDVFLQLPSWAKPQALLHAVVLSSGAADQTKLSQLPLDELKEQMRETSVPQALAKCRERVLNIRSFSQTRIDGMVQLDQKGMLVFQMPFDMGWNAFVDGNVASATKVDAGLLGILVAEGEHQVTLRYRSPLLYGGAVLTVLSCVILSLARWRWPRIALPG